MIFLLDKDEKQKIVNLVNTYDFNNETADFLNENIINENFLDTLNDDYDIKELDVNDYLIDKYYQNKKQNLKIRNQKYKPFFKTISHENEKLWETMEKLNYK